jgi:hypothetical protein
MNTGDSLRQYFASLAPWLVTFIFGAAVFLVGRILQKKERQRAYGKVFSSKTEALRAAYNLQQPYAQLGEYPGKAKEPQKPTGPAVH